MKIISNKFLLIIVFYILNIHFIISEYYLPALSQKTNYYISGDSYGLTWISSIDGINVYNGNDVKVYRPGLYNMKGNNIQSHFFEDCNTNMWFTTYNALHVYERLKDNFIPFQFTDRNGKSIEIEYKVIGYSNQFIFLRYGDYFGVFDINLGTLVKSYDLGITEYVQFDINIKDKRLVLACIRNDKVDCYISNDFTSQPFSHIMSSCTQNTTRVQIDNEKGLLYNNKNIIYRYDYHTTMTLPYFENDQNNFDFCVEPIKRQLIIMNKNEIKGYNSKGVIIWREKKNIQGNTIPMNLIGSVLWYGVDGKGVCFFDVNKRKFIDHKLSTTEKGINARGLFQDSKGRYWYTSRSDGIGKFDVDANLKQTYTVHNKRSPSNFVLNLIELTDGSILAIGGLHLLRYNEELDIFEDINCIGDISKVFFGGIHLTKRGKIVIENWNISKQLLELHMDKGRYIIKPIPIANNNDYEFTHLSTRISDTLFLSINGTQLGLAEFINDTLKIIKTYSTNAFLNDVAKIGNIYYFSFSDGIYFLKDGQLSKLNPNDDFLNQNSYAILAHKNSIFISTNSGLISHNLGTSQSHGYSIADGLQELEFNHSGALKDIDGNFWFGGINGVNKFNPDSLKLLDHKVPIALTSLKINGKESNNYGILHDLSKLNLSYFDNTIEFNFNGIDYSDPENVQLKYQLQNYEPSWNIINDNKGFARYPNLPPGTYHLQILASNSDGIWNTDPKTIEINITPPFYQTWWFQLLSLTILAGSIYLFVKRRFSIKLEKQQQILREQKLIIEKQEAVEAERVRIASEMHDDLGAGLTTIRILSERALRSTENDTESEGIKRISDQSAELISNMSEIIWALNSRFDTTNNLTAYIRRYVGELLTDHDLEFEFNANGFSKELIMSGEKRRNVFLIIKELLHNCIKYSNARKVEVDVFWGEGNYEVTVKEIGCEGYDFEKNIGSGNGLINIMKRVEKLNAIFTGSRMDNGMKYHIVIPLNP